MRTHVLTVKDRGISTDDRLLYKNTANEDEVSLELDGEWDGLTTVLTFKGAGATVSPAKNEDGTYTVPHEVLTKAGEVEVWAEGADASGKVLAHAVMGEPFVVLETQAGDAGAEPSYTSIAQAVDAANAATAKANAAAESANSAAGDAEQSATAANESAEKAAQATAKALESRVTSATAETLEPGSQATAALVPSDGAQRLELGIPRGEKGDKGEKGEKGEVGATPSVSASATVGAATGTPSVTLTKGGTDEEPSFAFAFDGLKGETGPQGPKGEAAVTIIAPLSASPAPTSGSDSSLAAGRGATASGDYSTASGNYSTASGNGSTASGDGSTASGDGSTASGNHSTASGNYSTASGDGSTASGDYSTASGDHSTAVPSQSVALGRASTVQQQADADLDDPSLGTLETSLSVSVGSWSLVPGGVTDAVSVGNSGTASVVRYRPRVNADTGWKPATSAPYFVKETVNVPAAYQNLKRRIINVKDPSGDYDAVNLRTLNARLETATQEATVSANPVAAQSMDGTVRSTATADEAKKLFAALATVSPLSQAYATFTRDGKTCMGTLAYYETDGSTYTARFGDGNGGEVVATATEGEDSFSGSITAAASVSGASVVVVEPAGTSQASMMELEQPDFVTDEYFEPTITRDGETYTLAEYHEKFEAPCEKATEGEE